MTSQEPTQEEYDDLVEALTQKDTQLRQQREDYEAMLAARPTQDVVDAALAQRNTARQELVELEQERARLHSVLADTVSGVQNWVPDLTPVPQPPPEMDPAVAQAWVRDQIAARRAEWDRFVHRVTTQASV